MTLLPPPHQIWQAIETYLRLAYAAAPPAAVQARLQALRSTPKEDWPTSPIFERDPKGESPRRSLRLGNRFYPHMKLTIDLRPDGQGYLFRADTHDRHCCPPPESPEYHAFRQLMDANQKLAQSIEAAWADQHLPTFKTYLRDDLRKRTEAKGLRTE